LTVEEVVGDAAPRPAAARCDRSRRPGSAAVLTRRAGGGQMPAARPPVHASSTSRRWGAVAQARPHHASDRPLTIPARRNGGGAGRRILRRPAPPCTEPTRRQPAGTCPSAVVTPRRRST